MDTIDMAVFESKGECDEGRPDINNCLSIYRIIYSLKYYTLLNTHNDDEGQSTFINFIQMIYSNYLNDIIHLTKVHGQDLENINKLLFTQYGFKKCDIKSCVLSGRHCQTNGKNNDNDNKMDAMFTFYQNTFDAIHHYLLHLFDLGLRSVYNDDYDDETKELKEDVFMCYNAAFERKQKHIQNKRMLLTDFFQRFKSENNRFLIQPASKSNHNDNREDTFLDGLCKEIGREKLSFLFDEEYDTVSIHQDIDRDGNEKTSNICNYYNKELFEKICQYINYHRLKSMSFSTGFTFWYWPYYAENKTNKQPIFGNINDFDGYSVSDLYIASGKCDNFKDEILEYPDGINGNITMDIYQNIILLKSQQYMTTNRVKNIKAKKPSFWKAMRHYDIVSGSVLPESHIIALIIYCDFSKISSSFSSTFRCLQPLESLESVKQRNKKYYWLSKILRESVEIYGDSYPVISGPLYTGMTFVMIMPAFNIRLNGPTSTSTQIEIAINFSENKGTIIQLNNQYGYGQQQRFFDVSWLSTFKEEDERFTFSGTFPLEIQGIINMKTKQNFKLFFKPLFYLDCILSGSSLDELEELNNNEISIISEFMNRQNVECDKYIIDTFDMFCLNKKTITINIHWINNYCSTKIQNMLFESIKGVKSNDNINYNIQQQNVNVLRFEILNIFPNLKNIIIYSTDPIENKSYPFSLFVFVKSFNELELVKNGNPIKCVINGVWKDKFNKDGKRSWLVDQYSSSSHHLFGSSLTSYKNTNGFFHFYNDQLTISSSHNNSL